MDYEELRDIYQKEKESNALSYAGDNFYNDLKEFLDKLSKEAEEYGGLKRKEYENSKRMAGEIIRIRLEKLAVASVREIEPTGLTKEEEQFNKEVLKQSQELKKILNKKEANIKKVKVMKDIRAYRGLDGNIYGPFSKGEEVELPEQEAQWLKERGFIEVKK